MFEMDFAVERGLPADLERIPAALAQLRPLREAGRFDFGLPALEGWLAELLG